MTTGDHARRTSGWEAMHRNLAADDVLAEAVLYASGGRRLTVEHGQPLTEQAAALVRQLVDDVDQAVADAGYLGGGSVSRPADINLVDLPVVREVMTQPSRVSRSTATRAARTRCRAGTAHGQHRDFHHVDKLG
jgi:hypothetical protein